MTREFVILADDGDENYYFFLNDDVRVAKVELEDLPAWVETGHIEEERSYTIRELLENMEYKN